MTDAPGATLPAWFTTQAVFMDSFLESLPEGLDPYELLAEGGRDRALREGVFLAEDYEKSEHHVVWDHGCILDDGEALMRGLEPNARAVRMRWRVTSPIEDPT